MFARPVFGRHAALCLLPLLVWATPVGAQTPRPSTQPAPEVDQALRARVTQFLQDFVDGQFRKALKFVAEDSQDLYFASAKAELKSFKLDDIKYDDNFQKATVYFTTDRQWKIHFEGLSEVPITVQMSSTWKLEDGEWCWYFQNEGQPWVTAMGPSDAQLISKSPDGAVIVPKVIDQNTANAAADKILRESDVDKTVMDLSQAEPSSDKIVFHNTVNGQVTVELLDVPKIPGLRITVDKDAINAGQSALIEAHYDPPAERDPEARIPNQFFFTINIHPFEEVFGVRVNFPPPPEKQ